MSSGSCLVLRKATVVTPYEVIREGYVVVDLDRGTIIDVGREPYRNLEYCDELVLEYSTIGPGFVDTHIHGAVGVDLSTATAGSITELSRSLPRFGVTSYVPTSVTLPKEELNRFCRNALVASRYREGSRILGVHLEGPYINPGRAGAQNPAYARGASIEELDELIEACGGLLRSITVAPEVEGVLDLLRYAVTRGLVAQIGHTNATYSKTMEAVRAGASKATHLYNAMSGFHHRSPGAALALLRAGNTHLELIVDLVHVAPEVVEFTVDYASYRRVVLVTDSIAAAGQPDGIYRLGDLEVEVRGGVARLAGRDVLAGSTLTMDRAFSNMLALGYRIDEVFHMASTAPAKSLGLQKHVGAVLPGHLADLVILDRELKIAATLVGGEIVYVRDDYKGLLDK